ncbi:MAG: hypothetical protein NWQ38_01940, partial [Cellulophaga sp.]|nr:hypothetical protein [Cellulophaga sp.]
SSDERIETEVTLRGKLNLSEANPHDGTIVSIKKVEYLIVDGQEFTKAKLQLKSISAIFWISN